MSAIDKVIPVSYIGELIFALLVLVLVVTHGKEIASSVSTIGGTVNGGIAAVKGNG